MKIIQTEQWVMTSICTVGICPLDCNHKNTYYGLVANRKMRSVEVA